MGNRPLPFINPISFMQTITTHSIAVIGGMLDNGFENHRKCLEEIGLSVGKCFETAFRKESKLTGKLEIEQYVSMIITIKNNIGANFSRASNNPGYIHLINTRCPFGDSVRQAPDLCTLTSSVFGGIAARNFGCSKVSINKSIGANDDACDVCIHFDPNTFPSIIGDEYYFDKGVITGKYSSISINDRIYKQMCNIWHVNDLKSKKSYKGLSYIVGKSEPMARVLEIVETIAPTDASALIRGESGVGKELIARAIHAMSGRCDKKFIAVNCGSIPENLIESELFGHEKGAFTSACEVHRGYFERAEGGSLFLDEIDSLSLQAQVRLLRVLQEGEFVRVGGEHIILSNVRIITAGSKNINELINNGVFRADLYYRLNVVPIYIPPLRERKEDIPPLVEMILEKLNAKYNKNINHISHHIMVSLVNYNWPGNVRELENAIERAVIFSKNNVITEVELPVTVNNNIIMDAKLSGVNMKKAKKEASDNVEVVILREAMKKLNGNISKVAKLLNLTTRAIHQKLRSHQISTNHFKNGLHPLD